MTQLNTQQKQLLFDYCIGLTTEKEASEARQLISSNEKASETHSNLKAALAPLESYRQEPVLAKLRRHGSGRGSDCVCRWGLDCSFAARPPKVLAAPLPDAIAAHLAGHKKLQF
jgi:hypothetical protein